MSHSIREQSNCGCVLISHVIKLCVCEDLKCFLFSGTSVISKIFMLFQKIQMIICESDRKFHHVLKRALAVTLSVTVPSYLRT